MMPRQYQSHERLEQSTYTSSKNTTSNKKKVKKEKVLSLGFIFTSLIIALIAFFVFLSIGVIIGPNFPL
ncbi:MAG: hypothetical protein IIY08_01795 [Cellulosilyticum sp.]|nr:hypothetical protein [Cellulosilyticum sp.]